MTRFATEGARQDAAARPSGAAGWMAWVVPSLADVMFATLLGFVLALRAHQLVNSDGDLARHLAVGRQILADGAVPTVDLFSHTRSGGPFVPYEWLSEVLFALLHRQWGLEGVAVLSATAIALPFLLLTRWTVRDGINPFVVLPLVVVGALASSMHWLARPHIFTILLALMWTRLLARHRESGAIRHLLPLPPLMALWANLHGGFLVGFVVLGVHLLLGRAGMETRERPSPAGIPSRRPSSFLPLIAAGLASLVAVGANPAGYAVLPHVLSYFRSQFMVDNTVEYMSPNFHTLGPQLFLALVLLAVVSLAATPRRMDPADLGMLAVWTAFSLYSARNIPLFVVTCLPIVARLADEALRASRSTLLAGLAATERQLGRPLLPALCAALALLVSTGGLGGTRLGVAFDPAIFPVEALARADEVGVRGNLFNYFSWGGYVLYAGYPRHRVFIDGQTDFYGEALMRDYLEVAGLRPGWESVLDRHRTGWVLFPHRSPLSIVLARSPGWRLAYEDGTADVFVRVPAEVR